MAASRFEFAADIFNLPNLLNDDWGLVRETSAGEARAGLVLVTGWDESGNRPVYTLPVVDGAIELPPRRTVLTDLSRWRIQLGLRAMF